MTEKRIKIQCFRKECKHDPPTEVIVQVPRNPALSSGKKTITVYCDRNHENVVEIPDTWGVRPLVLGEDIIGYDNNTPIFKGRDPYDRP